MTDIKALWDKIKQDAEYNLRQTGAGLAETFLGSPDAKGVAKVVPNSMFGLYGMMNAATGNHLPGGAGAAKLYESGVNAANRQFNVKDPKNFMESLNRIAGAAVLPGPKIEKMSHLGPVTRTALETILPLNQTHDKFGMLAAVGIPAAMNEAVADTINDPNYTSLLDQVKGHDKQAELKQMQQDTINAIMAKRAKEIGTPQTGPASSPQATAAYLNAKLLKQQEQANSQHTSYVLGAALAAGVIGGGVVATRALRAKLAETPELSGARPNALQDSTTLGTKLKAATIDQSEPIFQAAKDAGVGDQSVQQLRDLYSTRMNAHAISAQTKDAAITGELGTTAARAPKLRNFLDKFASLSVQDRNALDDVLMARSKQQQLVNEGATNWGGETHASLGRFAAAVDNNPDIQELMAQHRSFYQAMRDYMYQSGYVDKAKYLELNRKGYDYAPSMLNYERDPTLEMMKTYDPTSSQVFENMIKRQGIEHGVQPGEVTSPSTMMLPYLHHVIRTVEHNNVRRTIVDQIMANQGTSGKEILKRVPKQERNTITIIRDGKQEYYKGEPSFIASMQDNPAMTNFMIRGMSHLKRVYTSLTTGVLAPQFAPTAAMYEMGTALLTRPANRGLGLVSELMNRMGAPTSTVEAVNRHLIVDPTSFVSPVTGALHGLYSDMLRAATHSLERSLSTGGSISSWLGPAQTRALADTMGKAYMNSAKRIMDEYGAGSAPLMEHLTRAGAHTDVVSVSPDYATKIMTGIGDQVRASYIARAYNSLLENIHNGVRIQHMASNLRKGMSPEELTTLAADTRRLTGDATVHGGPTVPGNFGKLGLATQNMNAVIPWLSISVQSGRAFTRAFAKDPSQFLARTALLSGTAAGIIMAQMNNPTVANRYWNEWNAGQRSIAVPVFNDNGDILFMVSLPQEVRNIWSALIEGMGTVTGLKAGRQLDVGSVEDLQRAVSDALNVEFTPTDVSDLQMGQKAAMGAVIPRPIPPLVGAGLAGAGINTSSIFPWEGRMGSGWRTQEDEHITAERQGRVVGDVISAKMEGVLAELMGAAFTPFIDDVRALTSLYREGADSDRIVKAIQENTLYDTFADRTLNVTGEPLWGTEKRLSTVSPWQDQVTTKVQNVQQVMNYLTKDRQGTRGSVKPRPGIPDIGYQTIDPTIIGTQLGQVALALKPMNNYITKQYKPKIQALYNQLTAMPGHPYFAADPYRRRERENQIKQQIRDTQKEAYYVIRQYEDDVGRLLGIPDFRLNDIDIAKLKATPTN